ncbi:hypothetical protein [Shewanella mangrovisoli]|uniref:hypothetical protein n=1 Tax=Shewanella mangrovisoli TaxID=2864211 RepID=UPI0035B71459
MSIELPKALSLWSDKGDHAGFMLLACDSGSTQGDCVFMLSPASTEGIDSDLGIVVSELKAAGEHKFESHKNDDGFEIRVLPAGFPEVVFKLNNEFSGQVITEFNEKIVCIGSSEPVKKSA